MSLWVDGLAASITSVVAMSGDKIIYVARLNSHNSPSVPVYAAGTGVDDMEKAKTF